MRFLRILRATFAIISLLLCLATAVLWVRSYFKGDHFGRMISSDTPQRFRWTIQSVQIGKGGVGWHQIVWSAPPSMRSSDPNLIRDMPMNHLRPPPSYPDFTNPADSPRRNKTFLGFKLDRDFGGFPKGATFRRTIIIVPFWSVALLCFLLASPWLIHLYRHYRRAKLGFCTHCGYDLRASSEICPECGQAKPFR
jgi:hypothetical protein